MDNRSPSSGKKSNLLSCQQLELIVNLVNEGIIVLDINGRVILSNKAAALTLGYHPEDLVGRNGHQLWHHSYVDGTPYPAARCPVCTVNTNGVTRQGEDEFFWRKDGSSFPIRYTSIPLWEKEDLTGMVIFFTDITGFRALEEQLRQAQKMETIGRLTSGIIHDFNNTLMVIIGHSDILLSQFNLDNETLEEIRRIKSAAQRTSDLVRQLLSLSRPQLVQPEILDLNKMLVQLKHLLQRLIRENIELYITTGNNVSPIKIAPVHLEQIIMNLVINALDAMPQGGQLTLKIEEKMITTPPLADMPPGKYVTLSIADTGIGMDETVLSRCFEPFFTTKPNNTGTGLGLSTVYNLVQQNNGYIQVKSQLGKGTTFTIYFPPAPPSTVISVSKPIRDSKKSPLEKATILLVENEVNVRKTIGRLLQKQGYQVLMAQSRQEIQELCRRHVGSIDLLITDVVMRDISGPEIARQLLRIYPNMKVLYISGHPYEVVKQYSVDLKSNFLQKPFTGAILLDKIDSLLKT